MTYSIYPVPIHSGMTPKVSDDYHMRSSGFHYGVDIMYRRESSGEQQLPEYSANYYMPSGVVPALTMRDGKVSIAKQIGTGGYVRIDHHDGTAAEYMHLSKILVKPGQSVLAGTPLGIIGHNPSGYQLNHLHFQFRAPGNQLVDPEPHLVGAKIIKNPLGFGWLLNLALAGFIGWAGWKLYKD